ncbi:MAG: hypothetical protein Q9N02_01740, partial [Ghiorsea sp.]|nr:hypothetical protein [Ghiorsea sp.]
MREVVGKDCFLNFGVATKDAIFLRIGTPTHSKNTNKRQPKASMTLYDKLQHASSEEDVKDLYIQ